VYSLENLAILMKTKPYNVLPTDAAFVPATPAPILPEPAALADHSDTNVQVQGVDEGDIVKTDGRYVFKMNAASVTVIDAASPGSLSVAAQIDLAPGDPTIQAKEIYLDGSRLVVTLGSYQKVQIHVYDISDLSAIRRLRFAELDGSYVSSRKIGPAFYLVAESHRFYEGKDPILPTYKDSASSGGAALSVGPDRIFYYDRCVSPGYLIVAGFSLDRPDDPLRVDAYLGSAMDIYSSTDHLYVAANAAASRSLTDGVPRTGTMIFKFALNDGVATFLNANGVAGYVGDQYWMDEYEGYFRVVTIGDSFGFNWARTSGQNAYVLDAEMNLVGKVENMAPGESLHSVRFMGPRGYLVTFKKIDPLFVLDLSVPSAPSILGQLKIPGFSDYLHPFDANHLIGVGKDTFDMGNFAWYQGLKISVFDVTDPLAPFEESKILIGDRGTESYVLIDPKAFLFYKARGILALPVNLYEIPGKTPETPPQTYGTLVWQGAYVYRFGETPDLSHAGRITHLAAGEDLGRYDRYVTRILTIGDAIYTISDTKVKANAMTDLAELGSLTYR
jgi:uncharacterized secreted protein with C-terminal beta-propeller domain